MRQLFLFWTNSKENLKMLKKNQKWWAFTFKNLLFGLFHWYDKNCTKYYFFASTSGTATPNITYSYIILHRYWYWIWASFKFDIQKNLTFFFEFHTVLQINFSFSIECYLGSLNIAIPNTCWSCYFPAFEKELFIKFSHRKTFFNSNTITLLSEIE